MVKFLYIKLGFSQILNVNEYSTDFVKILVYFLKFFSLMQNVKTAFLQNKIILQY
jgi:hypothetical protein